MDGTNRRIEGRFAPLLGLSALWVGVGLISGVQQFIVAARNDVALPLGTAVLLQIVAALPWIGLSVAIVALVRRVPLRGGGIVRPLVIHGAAALLTAPAANLAIVALQRAVGGTGGGRGPYLEVVWDGTLRWVHVVVVVYAVIAATTQLWLDRARPRADADPDPEHAPEATREVLTLREGSTTLRLDPCEIDWLEADGDYVRVHAGGRRHLVNHRLAELAERLAGAGFIRVHRSAVVHPARVRSVRPVGRGDQEVTLTDGSRVRVSRRRAGDLRRALDLPTATEQATTVPR